MIAYTSLGTNDLARASKFYDELFGIMGAGRAMEDPERMTLWAGAGGGPMFGVFKPLDGNPATVGNGVMVALAAENPAAVDKLYAKAIELGAKDAGEPGVRMDAFYIGYVHDLDGHKINFFCAKEA